MFVINKTNINNSLVVCSHESNQPNPFWGCFSFSLRKTLATKFIAFMYLIF